MRAPLALLAILLVAGCSTPAPAPGDDATGPIDLTGRSGLLAIDVPKRAVSVLSGVAAVGWMSPSGTLVTWNEEGFAVLVDNAQAERDVVPAGAWARIEDNGTGLALQPGVATWRSLRDSANASTTPLPEAPRAGTRWTGASSDLAVLVAEYPADGACANDLFIDGPQELRGRGCHLRVASDGRVGWTEEGTVRLLARDGTVANVTASGTQTTENPVFTSAGVVHLRITGGTAGLALTEVVGPDGSVLASMQGPRQLALQDVSADGRFLLASVFG